MRTRILGAVVVAVLAVTSLSACRTNVGYAATIDGTRYSESDITDYLTPAAQPVTGSDGSSSVPTRAFVVETLILERLSDKVLASLPGGRPSEATLKQVRQQVLGNSTDAELLRQGGVRGYSGSFAKKWLRLVVNGQALQLLAQRGVDVQTLVTSVKFPVSVNPRYGTWDAKKLSFDGSTGAGAPPFLKLPGVNTSAVPVTGEQP